MKIKEMFKHWFEFRENIFKTHFNKNVLISYILGHYSYKYKIKSKIRKNLITHTNFLEIERIADTFRKRKFNVDIINYMSNKSIDYSKYDIIFGFGMQYEKAIIENQKALKIYYGTGAHVCQRNFAELYRIKQLKERKGVIVKPKRLLNPYWYTATVLSDIMFILGNEFTVNTYRKYFNGQIFNIPVSAFIYFKFDEISKYRKYELARKNFLWFGSSGLVLKGLDLCIEAFSSLPEYTLHICGPKEIDFFELYEKDLNRSNIIYHGFVFPNSKEFKEIVSQCGFALFPSASEGCSSSLLTTMATGLIPVSTIESGVDMHDFGFILDNADINSIRENIIKASNISRDEFVLRSTRSADYVIKNHTLNQFDIEFNKALDMVLKG